MSKELESKVQEMLKEETWTRATISNYTKNNLKSHKIERGADKKRKEGMQCKS